MLQWQPPTCARNPEVQFVFPICIESLKTALANATCTYEDLVDVRESSGQHVRDILDFDLNDPRKVPGSPSRNHCVCVCVCVCVCIRQRHHSYVHERETHTVTDSDREGDTFTHIHTFFHSLSLSLSLSIYLSLSLVSILLDLSRSLLCDRKVERTMSHARSLRRDHSPNRHFARERDSQNFSKETHTPLVLDGRLQEPCDLNYQTIHHQVPVFEIGFLSTLRIAFWKTL
jgi:hypothetical protein